MMLAEFTYVEFVAVKFEKLQQLGWGATGEAEARENRKTELQTKLSPVHPVS